MDNVIIILGGYKPNMSANGVCIDRIIRCLREAGYDVDCIAYGAHALPAYEDIDQIHIHRVKPLINYHYRNKAAIAAHPLSQKWYGLMARFFDLVSVFYAVLVFPKESAVRSWRMKHEAARIAYRKNTRLVIGVNFPVDSLHAAWKLKKKNPRIKFIAYCLDPLSGGKTCRLLSSCRSAERIRHWEEEILRIANATVVQYEHQGHFASHCLQLQQRVHYLGVPLLQKREVQKSASSPIKTVLFAGTLSKRTRNPQFVFEVFRHTKNTKLVMYVSSDETEYRRMASGIENVTINAKVPYDMIQQEYLKADAFLNIGNTQAIFAPSKIIEYISYGKPILSTYRVDGDTCFRYMEDYPNGMYVDERTANPVETARQIDAWLSTDREPIPYEQLQTLYYGNTPEAFLKIVDNVMAEEDE